MMITLKGLIVMRQVVSVLLEDILAKFQRPYHLV